VNRGTVSFGAEWLVSRNLVQGRVLDYGCGFGFDADYFGWEAFDPYYRQQKPEGQFDTIICNHVINMLTRASRAALLDSIQKLLTETGVAWLIVPRNIPRTGKVTMRKRIQNFVHLSVVPSVYVDEKLEIYRMAAFAEFEDKTEEIERRLSRSK
jgi:2-polyprenyl-3-methyl-5-hydroxy-6-metoxy-1,4-benzoquinol methylase